MKVKYIIYFLLITPLFSSQIRSENNSVIDKFIPKGWKLLYQTKGDLNKDVKNDYVIIIEKVDKKNITRDSIVKDKLINTNPRAILVIMSSDDQYKVLSKNFNGFIAPENENENSCLVDPLAEFPPLEIKNGVLHYDIQYWYSCGSWYSTNVSYLFRYQNNQMALIGFSVSSYHRASGEMSDYNINFSTGKMESTSGGNMFGEEDTPSKTKRSNLKNKKIYSLDELTSDTYDKMLGLVQR